MISFLCDVIAKIAFSNINGIVLIPLLIFLFYLIGVQAVETIKVFKEV